VSAAALIWCPFPDEDAAARAVEALLDEGLVACGNLIPGMRSLYLWRGERGEARETGALLKTRADRLERALARVVALHPYETPAAVGWRCDGAAPATLEWLGELA
jgi:periplasmic divalent cation tolerance protein